VDAIAEIFSHLCGQERCFVVDGRALPLCQRCLGLYAGAALTMAWLIASGLWGRSLWRRGLPCRSVLAVNILCLTAAMLGGMHIIDIGPRWRMLCGLWTGHVAVLWLVGASMHLWRAAAMRTLECGGCDAALAGPAEARAALSRFAKATQDRRPPNSIGTWRLTDKVQAIAASLVLAIIAGLADYLLQLGWWFWTVVGAAGVVAMVASAAMAFASVVRFAWKRGHSTFRRR